MSKSRYSGLIECSYCHKRFKFKRERSKAKYVCQQKDKGLSDCPRIAIKEQWLDELIEMRFRRELSNEEIKQEIKSIEVSREEIKINYTNDPEPTILTNEYAQF